MPSFRPFLFAGAVAVFVSQGSVMKYLGAGANKVLSYGWQRFRLHPGCLFLHNPAPVCWYLETGRGVRTAIAFLYSGPAINVLAIILTARILGPEIGIARAVGAIVFSIVIGLLMHLMFRKEEQAKAAAAIHMPAPEVERPLWQTTVLFIVMVGLLISATWGKPAQVGGFWTAVFAVKWLLASGFAVLLGFMMVRWMGVKIYKLFIAGIVVLIPALAIPQQPLIAFFRRARIFCRIDDHHTW